MNVNRTEFNPFCFSPPLPVMMDISMVVACKFKVNLTAFKFKVKVVGGVVLEFFLFSIYRGRVYVYILSLYEDYTS